MQPIRPRRFSAQRTLLRSGERTRLHVQGQVAVRLTLPLDVERTKAVRPGPSGSATHTGRYARGRVAVPLTRGGTFGAEWQCHSHCHSMVSVPRRYVRGRVAVPLTRGCTLGAEWQCHSHCHSMVSVRGSVGPSDLRANRRCADAKTCLERAGTGLAQDGSSTSGGRSFDGRVSRPGRLMCSVLPILLRRHNPNRGTKDRKTN